MTDYLPPKAGFTIEGDRIRADLSVKRKVTGTAMGGILGCSPWSSPFQVACNLLGLADKDISDRPAVIAGQVCEEPIIRYAGEAYPQYGEFIPAREIFGKKEGSHEQWPSDFDDEIFAGHVDGIVEDADGGDHILEIKTSGNMDMWENGVPEHYFWQVALYNQFVAKSDVAYVVLGVMDQDGLKDPQHWIPSEDNVTLFKLDMDMDAVEAKLEEVRQWYREFIDEGITPPYDPDNRGDRELFARLSGLVDDEDSIESLLSEYAAAKNRIAEHESRIRDVYDTADALKDRIKDWMDVHQEGILMTPDGKWKAQLTERTSTVLDEKSMMADGIDLSKYRTVKTTKTFAMKPVRKA